MCFDGMSHVMIVFVAYTRLTIYGTNVLQSRLVSISSCFAPVLIVLRCIQEIISTFNGLHDKIMCEIRADDSFDSVYKFSKGVDT
jgi:hypothetical protein